MWQSHFKQSKRKVDIIQLQGKIHSHGITQNETKKKGNHDLKWSSPFNYQPKSCALATLFSRPAINKKKTEKEKTVHKK